MDELSEEDKLTVARARKVARKKTKKGWMILASWMAGEMTLYSLENVTYHLYCIYMYIHIHIYTHTIYNTVSIWWLYLCILIYVQKPNVWGKCLGELTVHPSVVPCQVQRFLSQPFFVRELSFSGAENFPVAFRCLVGLLRGGWDFHRHPWCFRRLGNHHQWLRGGVWACAMNGLNF